MKHFIFLAAALLAGSLTTTAHADALNYTLRCTITDAATAVHLAQDPRDNLHCDQANGSASVSLASAIDLTVGPNHFTLSGPVGEPNRYSDCNTALAQARQTFTAVLRDADTDMTFALQLRQNAILIFSAKSQCQGKQLQ